MKRLRNILPLLVILGGMLILFYPTISNFLIMRNASRAVNNYDASVEALSQEQYQKVLDAAHAYNEKLAQNDAGETDVLASAVNSASTDEEYNSLLNIDGDGMMGYITVPKLEETLPIYHGTSEKVLQSGIGHQVDKITTVLPTDTKQLAIEPGKDLVTLITCTPYAVNTHRLLVRGHRIPYAPQQQDDAKSTFHVDIPLQYWLPSLALIALLIAWHLWQRHERRRRQSGSAKVASGDSDSADIEPDGDLPPQPDSTNNQSHSSRRKGPGRHVRPA